MKTFIEINGKRYQWRVNLDNTRWSCDMCDGFLDSSICTASGCKEMPLSAYLKLAQPNSALNTTSGARRKVGRK